MLPDYRKKKNSGSKQPFCVALGSRRKIKVDVWSGYIASASTKLRDPVISYMLITLFLTIPCLRICPRPFISSSPSLFILFPLLWSKKFWEELISYLPLILYGPPIKWQFPTVPRHRLGKHVLTETDTHETKELLGASFLIRSMSY